MKKYKITIQKDNSGPHTLYNIFRDNVDVAIIKITNAFYINDWETATVTVEFYIEDETDLVAFTLKHDCILENIF